MVSTKLTARLGTAFVRAQAKLLRGRLYLAEQGRLTLGLLPLSAISNGHTYFVQHPRAFCAPPCSRAAAAPHARPSPQGAQTPPGAQEPLGVPTPLGVHTTFQFGDSAGFAFGKRERLRQASHILCMGHVHGNTCCATRHMVHRRVHGMVHRMAHRRVPCGRRERQRQLGRCAVGRCTCVWCACGRRACGDLSCGRDA